MAKPWPSGQSNAATRRAREVALYQADRAAKRRDELQAELAEFDELLGLPTERARVDEIRGELRGLELLGPDGRAA